MNRKQVIDAIEGGILDYVKNLAAREAENEVTEDPATAETQFARGLRIAKDAVERCTKEAETIFPE